MKTIVSNAQSDTRSKPFTYSDVECRSNTLSKVSFPIMVTNIHLCANATTNKPISTKAISFYLKILCCIFLCRQTN